MTDLRTAAQQALEALEGAEDHLAKPYSTDASKAVVALRAALAQQAEPGEPVAWMDPATGDVISDARHEAWERDFGLAGKGKAALFTVPLYTAPPQRKLLTDEEIERICASLGFAQLSPVEVARAVERAHGIPKP